MYVNCQCPYCKCLARQRQLVSCHFGHCVMFQHVSCITCCCSFNCQPSIGNWLILSLSVHLSPWLMPPPVSRWTDCPPRISPMTQPPSELQKCKSKLVWGRVDFLNWFFSRAFSSVLISTIWCFRPYKPYIFCKDMILAACQCHSLLSWAQFAVV